MKYRWSRKMENNKKNDVIDLLELLNALRKKAVFLIVGLFVGAVVAGAWTKFMVTPQYQASSMIYILTKTTSVTSLTDLQIGSQLTVDFATLATSRPVINEVRSDLNLETISYEQFVGMLSITNPSNTRILKITVTYPDAETAKEIANAMANSTADRVAEIMMTDRPTVVEEAVTPAWPSSPNTRKNIMMGALAGLVLVAAVVIVRFLMDDTIKTEEDVEKYLQLNTLAAFGVDRMLGEKRKETRKKRSA